MFPHVREELDDVIHIEEVHKAVKQMKCNKASGGDGIPAEVYKHGGTTLVHHRHRLFLKIWDNEEVPARTERRIHCDHLQEGESY